MKILVVSQYYPPEPFRIHELCREMVCRGHSVTVLTGLPNYPEGELYPGWPDRAQRQTLDGVDIHRCRLRPRHHGNLNLARNYISFVLSAWRYIRENPQEFGGFDLIYVYQLSPITSALPALWLKKRSGTPILMYCLDLWPEPLRNTPLEFPPVFRFFTWLSRCIYSAADGIAVTSLSFAPYLSVLCPGSPPPRWIPQHSDPVELPAEYPEELAQYRHCFNFVFTGNVGEAQDMPCILRAAALLRSRERIRIHIVGSGSCLEQTKAEAETLGVKDAVIFHGRQPRETMPRFYAMANVCLVTLRNEGLVGITIPGKLQEYMAAGKPVLACLNGDAAQVIREADCGLAVNAEDAPALADAMEKMAAPDAPLAQYGANAKKYFDTHFTLRRHMDAVESMMNEITA